MRILHVIDKSFLGGGQTAVRHLLAGLQARGHETLLACRTGGPLVEAARSVGTRVHPIAFDKRFRPRCVNALAALVRASGAQLVHAHGLVAATHCVLARALGARRPLLYHQHGFHHHNYAGWSRGLRRASERFVAQRCARVLACSATDHRALVAGGYGLPQRIALVHYGLPEPQPHSAASDEASQRLGLDPARPLVGLVGRLHPQKAVDVFVRAAALVARARPEAQFVVVGTGELEHELHALARSLGLDGRLYWAGGQPGTLFVPCFDVAVLCSRWEGMPLVLLEYMAAARPLVATDLESCREALGDTPAEMVPCGDAAALAEAVCGLLSEPQRAAALGQAARRRFESEFTLALMTRRVEALYEEVLA